MEDDRKFNRLFFPSSHRRKSNVQSPPCPSHPSPQLPVN
jgi:hypothetical protein